MKTDEENKTGYPAKITQEEIEDFNKQKTPIGSIEKFFKSNNMEQKHTPYYYVDKQEGDRYCLMDGNDMSKSGAYRMLEEIKKVSALTKENERLREERKNQADKYNDLRNLIQIFHQTLIARNYNNTGKWHNERQEYNYELISEVEAILTSKS